VEVESNYASLHLSPGREGKKSDRGGGNLIVKSRRMGYIEENQVAGLGGRGTRGAGRRHGMREQLS